MADPAQFVKQHWKTLAAGFAGVLVLLYIAKHASAASSGAASSTASGPDQLQAYSAAADLQNAGVNGQVEVASLQAGVQSQQVAASAAVQSQTIAAQQDVTNRQTDAAVAEAAIAAQRDVTIQKLQSDAAVKQTAIQGSTIDYLATEGAAVQLKQIETVGGQVTNLMEHSKHFGTDIQNFAPVIALETGQGGAATGIANANTNRTAATSPAATISAASSGIGTILKGLFA